MKLYKVMTSGKKIEMEKKKNMKAEKWIENCITFLKVNPVFIRIEKEDGTILVER
jgi:hypothetical protein